MKTQPLLIYGAGYTGIEFLKQRIPGYHIHGFIDDDPAKEGTYYGIPILGTKKDIPELVRTRINNVVVMLVDMPKQRLELCDWLEQQGCIFPSFHPKAQFARIGRGVYIHPSATLLGGEQDIADHVVIGPYVCVEGGAQIGRGTIISPYVFVGFDSEIGQAVKLYPRASVLPKMIIDNEAVIGPHVIIHKHVKQGAHVFRYAKGTE